VGRINTTTSTNIEQVFGFIFNYVQSSASFITGTTNQIPESALGLNPSSRPHYYIPQTITKVTVLGGNIPSYAFSGMIWLEEVVMPQTMTSLGSHAFYNNTNLAKVNSNASGEFNIPSGVTSIQPFTFYGNQGLTELNVFGAVTSIGANALQETSNLLEVSLPNTTSIGSEAFRGVTSLPSIALPEVTSIGASAFLGATGLVSVTAPKLTSINDYAFQGASSLTRFNSDEEGVFNLPSTVTSIDVGAFRNVGLMTEITVPFVGNNTSSQESYKHVFGWIFGFTTADTQIGVYGVDSQSYINEKYGSTPSVTTWQYTRITRTSNVHTRSSYYYYIPQTLTKITVLGGNIPVAAFLHMTW
jgi:hypothetical protein